jgi:DNA-binding MarR family transcriptional regulator
MIVVQMAEQALSRMLLDAFRALDAEMATSLEDRGVDLSPSHARAILFIDRAGTRLSDLAQRAAITKQAMMQVVDDLQERGLVRRASDPNDSRAKVVRLTAKGLRQRAEARRAVATVESRARRSLGDRRYEALKAILVELSVGEE